jgi:hypothetical protein
MPVNLLDLCISHTKLLSDRRVTFDYKFNLKSAIKRLPLLKWMCSHLLISTTIRVIRRNCSLINQPSSANHCCPCAWVCSYSVPPCLLEQGLLRPRDWSPVLQTQAWANHSAIYPYQKASYKFVAATARWITGAQTSPSSFPTNHVNTHGREEVRIKPAQVSSTTTDVAANYAATRGRFQLGTLHAPKLNYPKSRTDRRR